MTIQLPFRIAAMSAVALAATLAARADAALISQTLDLPLDNGNFTASGSKTTLVDVNLDGVNDFSFFHATSAPGGSPSNIADFNGLLYMNSAKTSQFLAVVKDVDAQRNGSISPVGNYAETLMPGFVVGGSGLTGFIQLSPGSNGYDQRLLDSSGTGNGGAFSVATGELNPLIPENTAYVGFAFGNIANPNYGYLYFTKIGNDDRYTEGDRNAATLTTVVYNDTPGVPVVIPGVPEPTTLGAIAAVGTLILRRRRRD